MSPEQPGKRSFEGLSSDHKDWVRDIAQRMEDGSSYFPAVRQVLANHRVTHEPDVERLMKTFSKPVDEIRAELQEEANKRAEVEADIKKTIAVEREAELLADMERVKQERGGDPDD